jgi:biopolymer transport protein ExbD
MRRRRVETDEEVAVDMSPLIDMVFILLIFFMVSTTFVKDMQVELNRPGASSATMSSSKSLRVYVDQFKQIYMNNEKVPEWSLQGRFRDALVQDAELSVLVVSDLGVPVELVIDIIDQARMAGIQDVGVATERDGDG